MNFNNILVATDFDNESHTALEAAVSLASNDSTCIHILHILDTSYLSFFKGSTISTTSLKELENTEAYAKFTASLKEASIEYLTELKKQYSDTNIITHTVSGRPLNAIKQIVEKHKVDLIITSADPNEQEGKHLQHLIRHIHVPILTVNTPLSDFYPKQIVFASDFEQKPAPHILEMISKWRNQYQAQLNLLKVITPATFENTPDTNATITRYISGNDLEEGDFHIFNAFSEEDGIISFANNINADLIIMVSHPHSRFYHFIVGSLAEHIANEADTPVLILFEKP
ncbi:universal stress protein [Limibacter armeniacum]|uniref:universal stress protein n=1 Tax=Limibacter armeniacum TaxID=466084 RepID=UPI002FE5DE4B